MKKTVNNDQVFAAISAYSQVFKRLSAVAEAANASLSPAAKSSVDLTDPGNFFALNEVMSTYLDEPYSAIVTLKVSAHPKMC